jgi:hypothetical protein
VSGIRILGLTASGDTVVVAVDGDELPQGHAHTSLYQPVRLYYADRDWLSEPLWLGSVLRGAGPR